MRRAAIASVAIHLGLIAGAWGFLQLKPAEDIGAESVSVDIISMDAVSIEPSETITEANRNLTSAGADTEAMEVPEIAEAEPVEVAEAQEAKAVEPVMAASQPRVVEPTEELASAEVMTAMVQIIAPIEAAMPQQVDAAATAVVDSVIPSQSDPLEAVRTASIGELTPEPPIQEIPQALLKPIEPAEPVETASLAPVIEEDAEVVPVPKPRIVRKPIEAKTELVEPPKERPKKQAEPTKKTPTKDKPQDKPPSTQASLGNGGAAEADTKASKKSGGDQGKKDDGGSAAASKYPGLVQAKVTRAVKRPPKADGKSGEAQVSFVVAANGSVASVALARSSGNATLDKAALAAVNRAAPFPPIPAAAGRSSWSFTVPISFKR